MIMTYSQIWNNSGNEADILYLEQQIKAVKKEIKVAKAAEQQEILEQANRKLAELEAKLDELEE
jgi:Tfp pilus assembly protein PilN